VELWLLRKRDVKKNALPQKHHNVSDFPQLRDRKIFLSFFCLLKISFVAVHFSPKQTCEETNNSKRSRYFF